MVVRHCLFILEELTQLERKIHEIEKFLEGEKVDNKDELLRFINKIKSKCHEDKSLF